MGRRMPTQFHRDTVVVKPTKAELPPTPRRLLPEAEGTLPKIEDLKVWADEIHPLGRVCPRCMIECSKGEPGIREELISRVEYSELLGLLNQRAVVYYHAGCELLEEDQFVRQWDDLLRHSVLVSIEEIQRREGAFRRFLYSKRKQESEAMMEDLREQGEAIRWVRNYTDHLRARE